MFSLEPNGTTCTLIIDGVDLSGCVTSCSITANPCELPEVTLTLRPLDLSVSFEERTNIYTDGDITLEELFYGNREVIN